MLLLWAGFVFLYENLAAVLVSCLDLHPSANLLRTLCDSVFSVQIDFISGIHYYFFPQALMLGFSGGFSESVLLVGLIVLGHFLAFILFVPYAMAYLHYLDSVLHSQHQHQHQKQKYRQQIPTVSALVFKNMALMYHSVFSMQAIKHYFKISAVLWMVYSVIYSFSVIVYVFLHSVWVSLFFYMIFNVLWIVVFLKYCSEEKMRARDQANIQKQDLGYVLKRLWSNCIALRGLGVTPSVLWIVGILVTAGLYHLVFICALMLAYCFFFPGLVVGAVMVGLALMFMLGFYSVLAVSVCGDERDGL